MTATVPSTRTTIIQSSAGSTMALAIRCRKVLLISLQRKLMAEAFPELPVAVRAQESADAWDPNETVVAQAATEPPAPVAENPPELIAAETGVATEGVDYTASVTQIVVPAGQTSGAATSTTIVSSPSINASSTTAIVAVPVVEPIGTMICVLDAL